MFGFLLTFISSVFQGDYVRLWIPELAEVQGGAVHTVWSQPLSTLRAADITLGQTYPRPLVTAPEWSKHSNRSGGGKSARGGGKGGYRGGSGRGGRGQNRGIDFYFKNSSVY